MGNILMRKRTTDFNLNQILNELNSYNSTHQFGNNSKTALSTFMRIKNELQYLNTNRFNYQGYSLKNSDQFIVDILCSTCFNKTEQLQLIKLYVDYTNSKQSANKINLDDLFLSCIEASTVKCSDLLLDECLKYNLKQKELLNGTTILDIAINTFGIKLYPIINRNHKFKSLEDTYNTIHEHELFILRLIKSGFKLSFKSISYDKCFLVLMFTNMKDLLLCDENSKELIDYINKSLSNLIDCVNDKRIVYSTLENILNQNENSKSDENFFANLKECLYLQIKKSTLDTTLISNYTSEKLSNLVLDSNRRFTPLRLDELCRKKIKTIYPNNCLNFDLLPLPLKIRNFLSYHDELSKNFLFYFFYFYK